MAHIVLGADDLRVAEEEALVEFLAAGEAGPHHIPGQAEERHFAVAVLTRPAEVTLNGGTQCLDRGGRWSGHEVAAADLFDVIDDLHIELREHAQAGLDGALVGVPDAGLGVGGCAFNGGDRDRLHRLQHRQDVAQSNLHVDERVGLRGIGDQMRQPVEEAGFGDVFDDHVVPERFGEVHREQREVMHAPVAVIVDPLPGNFAVVEDRDGIDLFKAAGDRVVAARAVEVVGIAANPGETGVIDGRPEAERVILVAFAAEDRQAEGDVGVGERSERADDPRAPHDHAALGAAHDAGVEVRFLLADRRLAVDLRGDKGVSEAEVLAPAAFVHGGGVVAQFRVLLPPVIAGGGDGRRRRVHVVGRASQLAAGVFGPGGVGRRPAAQIVFGAGNDE